MTLRALTVALLAAALAGCGAQREHGSATLWVTRDRGATVLVDATVPAGQTLLRALRSKAKVETRYGGRFVQGIDGVAGDESRGRDWFWFANGLVGDRSAAEYRIHPGDIVWWDYRDWRRDGDTLEVVVGAFPEPFLHGFDGTVRRSAVRYAAGRRADAERVAGVLRTTDVAPFGTSVDPAANLFELRGRGGGPRFSATLRTPGTGPRTPVRFVYVGDVAPLLSGAFRRRFEA